MLDVSARVKDNFKKDVLQRRIAFVSAQHPEAKYSANKTKYKPINKPMQQLSSSYDRDESEGTYQQKRSTNDSKDNSTFLQLNWIKKTKIGCGLKNYGQTCYLNSALQCLIHTAPLSNILLGSKNFRSDCLVSSRSGFCVLCEFQTHTKKSFCVRENENSSKSSLPFYPKAIVSNLKSIGNLSFHKQEDSHEFLRMFLEKLEKACILHRSLFKSYKNYYDIPKTVLLPGEEAPKYKPTSLVFAVFGGYLQSQVKCLSCSYESNTYDPFTDLSLSINKSSSIEKSLHLYCEKEVLDRANKYKCSGCKKMVQARKQLTIYQKSNVLTLQLNRFDHFGRKIMKPVQYPETLDIKPFLTDKSSSRGETIYSLYGVIMHHGSSQKSGHYTSFVKSSNGTWLYIDDESVSSVSKKKILSAHSEAYVLFYCRVDSNTQVSPSKEVKSLVKTEIQTLNMSTGMQFTQFVKEFKQNDSKVTVSSETVDANVHSKPVEPIKKPMDPKKVVKELVKRKTSDVKLDLLYNGNQVDKWDDVNNQKELDIQMETLESYKEQTKKRKRDQWDIDYDKGKVKKVKKRFDVQLKDNNFQKVHELSVQGKGDEIQKRVQKARKNRHRQKLFASRKRNKSRM